MSSLWDNEFAGNRSCDIPPVQACTLKSRGWFDDKGKTQAILKPVSSWKEGRVVRDYMAGGLPHLSALPHLHVNRPWIVNVLFCNIKQIKSCSSRKLTHTRSYAFSRSPVGTRSRKKQIIFSQFASGRNSENPNAIWLIPGASRLSFFFLRSCSLNRAESLWHLHSKVCLLFVNEQNRDFKPFFFLWN